MKLRHTVLLAASVLSASAFSFSCYAQTAPATKLRAGFSIGFEDIQTDLKVFSALIMPGGSLDIRTTATAFSVDGTLSQTSSAKGEGWRWTAPGTPGRYEIKFSQGGEDMLLNVFVLTPFDNATATDLNGYKIGNYTKTLFRGMSSYAMPKGFIDLADGPGDVRITPNFTLKQFICKQQPGHDPTYLLIRPATLIKLETLLEASNAKGWKADSLHVMSGFRTPHYNRSIGNRTTSSRHLYGGAADIWIDGDGDGRMDDLNKDGKFDKNDAREFAKLAESLAKQGGRKWPSGGLGVYGANAAHGPFIHVDTRGYRARWGH